MPLAMDEIKARLEGLEGMAQLKREDFADEGGYAHALAQQFRGTLKATQLHRFFRQIKQVQREAGRAGADEPFQRERILTLLPILVYSVGRDLVPKDFYEIVKICLSKDKLKTNGDFIRVAEFLEAIVAYHKYVSETQKERG